MSSKPSNFPTFQRPLETSFQKAEFQDEFHKNELLQLQSSSLIKNQQLQREERSNSSSLWQNAKDVHERSRETGRSELIADAKLAVQKTHGCRLHTAGRAGYRFNGVSKA